MAFAVVFRLGLFEFFWGNVGAFRVDDFGIHHDVFEVTAEDLQIFLTKLCLFFLFFGS